jgi:hypothetical protein
MADIQVKSKSSQLTRDIKKQIAHCVFHKGKNFLWAAKLLEEKGGYHSVVLHLLCQGFELIIKGLLLMQNYDNYKPRLKSMGHNLIKGVKTLNEFVAKSPKIDEETMSELENLNVFYRKHLFRYDNLSEFLKDPKTISSDLVMRYALKLVRFGNRKFLVLPA